MPNRSLTLDIHPGGHTSLRLNLESQIASSLGIWMLRLSRIVMLICPLVNQGFRQSSGGEKFPSPPLKMEEGRCVSGW